MKVQPLALWHRFAVTLGVAVCVIASSPWQVHAQTQDIKASLFAEADELRQKCIEERADILVPRSFEEGMKHYQKAEEDLERGRNLESIRKELSSAVSYFGQALEGTDIAEVTLSSAIMARDDAEGTKAPEYAPETWSAAEKKFNEGAQRLERGDVKSAQSRGNEAETLYRQAELEAIKVSFLDGTWALLDQAEESDVEKRAPKTLEEAKALVDQAELQLNQNRYDADEPRSLAQEANYQARHALYLASLVSAVEEEEQTMEDMLLASEEPLRRIAAELGFRAEFDEGPNEATEKTLQRISEYEAAVEDLQSQLAGRTEQIAGLEARISELEADLGGVQLERSELAEAIAAQAQLREKFTRVEQMFDRDEARVLREGNDVIVRLTGLTFAVGKSDIEPEYFALLTSVQYAIAEFPGARVSIEGHTDSFGGDEQNMQLSQDRADAVREYLLANMRLDPARIDAIGYGETRPVASNETPEGRAKNRRIEVVIHAEPASVN